MDIWQDQKFKFEAIDLLHDGLIDCPWNVDEESSVIDKDLLLKMFRDSKYILQSNPDDPMLQSHADTVFETCVSLVRCICINDKDASTILISGKEYKLYAKMQWENVLRNYPLMIEARDANKS